MSVRNIKCSSSTLIQLLFFITCLSCPARNLEWTTATFDGKNARLYQNGTLAGQSTANEKIVRPDRPTPFVLGAYKNNDEFFGIHGTLKSIKILSSALSAQEIKQTDTPRSIPFLIRPHLRFTSNDQAVVSWESTLSASAPVEGNAMGLAVINNRLYVSTNRGDIYAFSSP